MNFTNMNYGMLFSFKTILCLPGGLLCGPVVGQRPLEGVRSGLVRIRALEKLDFF